MKCEANYSFSQLIQKSPFIVCICPDRLPILFHFIHFFFNVIEYGLALTIPLLLVDFLWAKGILLNILAPFQTFSDLLPAMKGYKGGS
jgi:hypothetical protein